MAIIVVGGSGKGVGKTALVCGLIGALPEFRWTAVKITSHEYGKPDSIWEETEPGQGTDTARYLAAGAHRAMMALWRDDDGTLERLWQAVGPGANLIFESNRILQQLIVPGQIAQDRPPVLCLGVIGCGVDGTHLKPSFEAFMSRMDAVVVGAADCTGLAMVDPAMPCFKLAQMELVSPEMLTWLRVRLRV